MNILYIHGFASSFNSASDKIMSLKQLGDVIGFNIDYTESPHDIRSSMTEAVLKYDIDLIVGTSMGGYIAACVSSATGIPFVACNPAINPAETMCYAIGYGFNHDGSGFHLKAETVAMYEPFDTEACGLILLDEGDDLFSTDETVDALKESYEIVVFDGGSHRFEHMDESLGIIREFINSMT